MRALTPADDDLHAPVSDDPFWTETAWFAFAVPELKLAGHFYPVFRTNQNICSSGMYVWDDRSTYAHDALYCHTYWHLPMPETLTQLRLPSGLSYDVIEPLKKYRVRFSAEGFSADLVYTGLFEPILSPKGDHLDQPCHFEGWIELAGDRIDVNGFEMRDKSWHLRSDKPLKLPPDIANGAYAYGAREDFAFLVRLSGGGETLSTVQGGWVWRDGVVSPLQSGSRTVARSGTGVGDVVELEGTDEMGRTFRARGTTVSHFGYQATPAILAYLRGTEWDVEGGYAWGEDQEWDAARPPLRLAPRPR